MQFLSKYSVKRPITILMLTIIVVLIGFVSVINSTVDLFPSINLPYAIVTTQYPNASPEEVEMMVTKPFEQVLATTTNIKNVTSTSSEGMSMLMLEFNEDTNMDSALIDIRGKIDMVKGYLPSTVQAPMIMMLNPDMMPVMTFSVSIKDMSIVDATPFIEKNIKTNFEKIPGVATVSLTGTALNEISIKINQEKINQLNKDLAGTAKKQAIESLVSQGVPRELAVQYASSGNTPKIDITEEMILSILNAQNLSMPVGYLNEDGNDILVRIGDKIKSIDEIKELTLINSNGMTVKIEDVADVNIVDTSDTTYSKINGENAVIFTLQKQSNYATTDVVKNIQKEINLITSENDKVDINVLMNQGEFINLAVGSVTNNLLYGAVLSIIILFIFLKDIKPTFVIGIAIPISVMVTFIMIYFSGLTLNIISMGGLALGIGMLVDNSIVVIENIARLRSEGKSVKEAAVQGASQVAGAITASTLTTIAVFFPVIFMKGMTAEIFMQMALTITFSLIGSLLIALTLVPMLSSKLLVKVKKEQKTPVLDKLKGFYKKVLVLTLNNRLITVVIVFVLFIASLFTVNVVGTEFFPMGDQGTLTVTLDIDDNTKFETIVENLDKLYQEISNIEDVAIVSASYSETDTLSIMGAEPSLNIVLKEKPKHSTTEVGEMIRDLGNKLGIKLVVNDQGSSMGGLGGVAIQIKVKGDDLLVLEKIANDVAAIINNVKGTTEVNNGITKTSPELKITVDKDKSIANGLTVAQVYKALNEFMVKPSNAVTTNINGNDYKINVYDENVDVVTIEDIKNMTIKTNNKNVKLTDIAEITTAQGFASISRDNGAREIIVSANLKNGYNVGKVSDEITNQLKKYEVPTGYDVEVAGTQAEIISAMVQMFAALALAVVLIYMVMAAQFQSLLYPFIVMFTIPLAFTGGFLGLLITNTPISVVSFMGLIILSGIVVNNGIVLIDYVNQLKESGMSTYDALILAGQTRLRPILMTALTTILGLTTMALGIGKGAEMMQPMAITTIGGLLYATILTLVVVPVIYLSFDNMKSKFRKKRN